MLLSPMPNRARHLNSIHRASTGPGSQEVVWISAVSNRAIHRRGTSGFPTFLFVWISDVVYHHRRRSTLSKVKGGKRSSDFILGTNHRRCTEC